MAKVSNVDFLKAITYPARKSGIEPQRGRVWVNSRAQTGGWAGKVYEGKADVSDEMHDNYFCISLVQEVGGSIARQKTNFCALMCVVLDDVGTKADNTPTLEPSWKLETSPGNEQWGYILSKPVRSVEEADELFKKIANAGYTDPSANGLSTRYMRLPVGVNSKKEHVKNNDGKPYPVSLKHWEPDLRYSVKELEEGLNLEKIQLEAPPPASALSFDVQDNAEKVRQILSGESYHEPLLTLAASYIAKGLTEKDVVQIIQGMMLASEDQKDERWKQRFQDIERLVKSAAEKYGQKSQLTNFTVVSVKDFMAVSPPTWAVKNVLPQAGMAMIFGKSGAGKSFFALDLMLAIARGAEWCGLKTKPLRVVYVVAEGVSGFRNRLVAYEQYHGIDMTRVSVQIIPQTPNLCVDDDKALIQAIKAKGGVDIVVIDTLAQASAGANENSAEDMGAVLKRCQNVQAALGGLVVLVHHTGKDEARGARGWSGLKAAMDTEIEVSATMNGGMKTMEGRVTKQKDGEDGKAFPFRLQQVVLGEDEDGEVITSCVVDFDDSYRKLPEPTGKWQQQARTSVRELHDEYAGSIPLNVLMTHMLNAQPRETIAARDSRPDNAERAVKRMVEMGWFYADGDTVSLTRNIPQKAVCGKTTVSNTSSQTSHNPLGVRSCEDGCEEQSDE